MASGNTLWHRVAWTNIGVVGATTAYYAPITLGAIPVGFPGFTITSGNGYINADGFDHIEVRASLTSADVNNTLTLTVRSDDGTTMTFVWDETRGMYNWMTGAYGAASFVANNTTTLARIVAYNHNAKLWQVKLESIVAPAVAIANSGIIEIRLVKV